MEATVSLMSVQQLLIVLYLPLVPTPLMDLSARVDQVMKEMVESVVVATLVRVFKLINTTDHIISSLSFTALIVDSSLCVCIYMQLYVTI